MTVTGTLPRHDAEQSRTFANAFGLTTCPACGNGRFRHLFTVGDWCYVRCSRCGLAHLDPLPLEHEARAVFDDGYFVGGLRGGYDDYVADEALHRENSRLRIETLSASGITPGSLLDVGCAHGFFLDEARARGWTVRGVEVSPSAAAYAASRFGLHVARDLDGATRFGPYDVITLFQVLEHAASPRKILQQARAALTPNGALVIETWDRGRPIARLMRSHWHVIAPPSVMWLWDRVSLRSLLESAGLEVTGIRRTTKRVSARFVASLLDGTMRTPRCMGRLLERSPLRDWSFTYAFGDLITVTARPAL